MLGLFGVVLCCYKRRKRNATVVSATATVLLLLYVCVLCMADNNQWARAMHGTVLACRSEEEF